MSEYEAGRDTDALVAERLHNRPHGFYHWDGEVVPGALPFSTDISAAWTLVEKMDADGWLPSLQGCGGFGWRCTLETTSPDAVDVVALADTAPLAIVRAFLAATEA